MCHRDPACGCSPHWVHGQTGSSPSRPRQHGQKPQRGRPTRRPGNQLKTKQKKNLSSLYVPPERRDTYGDLLPLVRLQDPDSGTFMLPQGPHGKPWPALLWLSVAHVKDSHLVALTCCHATATGHSIVSAAAVPLAPVNLKFPHKTPIQDEGAGLLVFVPSGGGSIDAYVRLLHYLIYCYHLPVTGAKTVPSV